MAEFLDGVDLADDERGDGEEEEEEEGKEGKEGKGEEGGEKRSKKRARSESPAREKKSKKSKKSKKKKEKSSKKKKGKKKKKKYSSSSSSSSASSSSSSAKSSKASSKAGSDAEDNDDGGMPEAKPLVSAIKSGAAPDLSNEEAAFAAELHKKHVAFQMEDDDDIEAGPTMPVTAAAAGIDADYGGALRPGEGEAMAQYVQEGKRIPRRGEVGMKAEEIEAYESQVSWQPAPQSTPCKC